MITKIRTHKSRWTLLFPVLLMLGLSACGGGGSGDDDDDDPAPPVIVTPPVTPTTAVGGGGVKGPLAFAIVTVYAYDPTQPGFKGAIIATGTTNAAAQIVGLSVPQPLNPPYIVEFTSDAGTRDITTNQPPVITTMRTVITQALIDTGEPIYGTPLTTMAVDIAIANSNAATTPAQFLAALVSAAADVVSTLGFGMSGDIDIFDTPPLIDRTTTSTSDQADVAAYRMAVEAVTAIAYQINQQNSGGDTDSVLSELSADLADGGGIDGSAGSLINPNTMQVLEQDPATLPIPNDPGNRMVGEVQDILVAEKAITGSTTSTTQLGVGGSITTTPQPAAPNPDSDGDGTLNANDAFPNDPNEDTDTDGDGIGDNSDPDADGNGLLDADEAETPTPGDNDADLDGFDDDNDNCPAIFNPLQWDNDGDEQGDACDPDDDNDNTPDTSDAFPLDNGEQVDTDGDGEGNNADIDDDNDSVEDESDTGVAPEGAPSAGTACSLLRDCDGDGAFDNVDFDPVDASVQSNFAPVANADVVSVDEDASTFIIEVTANDTDNDGNPNDSVSLDEVGSNDTAIGSVVVDGDKINYTLVANANGTDEFTYTVTDGNVTAVGTVTVTVNAVNDPPEIDQAELEVVAMSEDGFPVAFGFTPGNVSASDVDGDTLSWSTPGASHGSATVSGSGASPTTVTYLPNANYFGADSFEIVVSDGNGGSDSITLGVNIASVNDVPVAGDDSDSTDEDTLLTTLDVLANDGDGGDGPAALSVTLHDESSVNGGNVVNNEDGTFDYTPAENFNGTDSFTYTVSDGADTAVATVTITVTPVNDPPVASPDEDTTAEDTLLTTLDVLTNDDDGGDGPAALSVASFDSVSSQGGSVSSNGDGTFNYTPPLDFNGDDSFNYSVSDGLTTAVGTVTIEVTPVNDDPVANPDSDSTPEDTPVTTLNVLANDTDGGDGPEEPGVTLHDETSANGGSVFNNEDGTFVYTPPENFNGFDSFNYTVSDGESSAVGTVTIEVTPVNDDPVANPDADSTPEDTLLLTLNVLANDSDGGDGGVLSVSAFDTVSSQGGSVASIGDGTFNYTPPANFNGEDSFNYTVSDTIATAVGTVTITVTPVNDDPVANSDEDSTSEDTPLTTLNVLLNDNDGGDGGELVIAAFDATSSQGGSVTSNGDGTFDYTPPENFHGEDSFNYTVSDGIGSAIGTVSISVSPVNDAPQANADEFFAAVSIPTLIDVLANDSDVDNDALSIVAVTQGSRGSSVVISGGGTSITFTDTFLSEGVETFTYDVSDGEETISGILVTMTVTANNPPVANPDSAVTNEDTQVTTGNVLANDTDGGDGGALGVSAFDATSSQGGSVTSNENGSFNYTPPEDFSGEDSFTYTLSDTFGTAVGTVTINVNPVNDPPVANADEDETAEDTPFTTLDVLANDSDGGDGGVLSVSASDATSSQGGSVSSKGDGTFDYEPPTDFFGVDSFNYTVSDGEDIAVGTVTIEVTPVNDGPVANADADSTDEDTPFTTINVLLNDSDGGDGPEDIGVTLHDETSANGGSVANNEDGTFVYTPPENFHGDDSFTYTVSDGEDSAVATVTITVNPVNDAPVANADADTTAEDTPLTTLDVLANDGDIDGPAALNVSTFDATSTQGGSVTSNNDGTFEYTPPANFDGDDSFTYTVSDSLASAVGTVTITVTPVNDPPVANADLDSTEEDTPLTTLDVTANDTDGGDGPGDLSVTAFDTESSQGGSVTSNGNGTFEYMPPVDFNGDDSFTYTVSDTVNTAVGTVTITVTPVNDPPVANDDADSTAEDTPLTTLDVLANDTDGGDGGALSITAFDTESSQGGSVTSNGDGTFNYTPPANFDGDDTFTYTVSDTIASAVGTVTITVGPVNDAPVANDDADTTAEDTSLTTINVLANDTDSDGPVALSVSASDTTSSAGGSVSDKGDGTFDYTPPANFSGDDTFNYTVSDSIGSAVGTVTITVTPVNDPPVANADADSTAEDTPLTTLDVLANDTDGGDGGALSVTAFDSNSSQGGSVASNGDGTFNYTPPANFSGDDTFTYTVSDTLATASGTVTITVTPVNDPPVANADADSTAEDTPLTTLDVLENDSDGGDGGTLSVSAFDSSSSEGGSVSSNGDGTFEYTPPPDFNGDDSFTYTVSDTFTTAVGTVTIEVTAVNDDPVAADDLDLVIENTPLVTVNVLDNDSDVEGDSLSVAAGDPDADHGIVVNNGDGTFTYTPEAEYLGPDSFDYTVEDGNGGSDSGTVFLTVAVTGTATVSELLDPDYGGGVVRIEDQNEYGSVHPLLIYEIEQYNPQAGNYFEIEYFFDYQLQDFQAESEEFDGEFQGFLKADGSWLDLIDDGDGDVQVTTPDHGDGSMSVSVIDTGTEEEAARFRVRAQTVDIEGQLMSDYLNDDWTGQLFDPNAEFGPGAQRIISYELEAEIDFVENDTFDTYCAFNFDPDFCAQIYLDENYNVQALSLDDLVVDVPWFDPDEYNATGLIRLEVSWNQTNCDVLHAELLSTDNTVNYYVLDYCAGDPADYITLQFTDVGGWERDSTILNTDILRFVVPQTLVAQFPDLGESDVERRRSYLERSGVVYEVELILAGELEPGDDNEINGNALNQILANLELPQPPDFNKLVGTWIAELPSSQGDRRLFHIFDEGDYEASGHCDLDGSDSLDYGLIYDLWPYRVRQWNEDSGDYHSHQYQINGDTECGLVNWRDNGRDKLLVDGDTLTHSIPGEGDFVYHRLQAAPNPLIGSWIRGEIWDQGEGHEMITFLDDSTLSFAQDCDSEGQTGYEYGSYTWDPANGVFSGVLTIDTNGACGLHHDTGLVFSGLTLSVDGDTLVINDGSDTVFRRHSSGDLPCGFESEWDDLNDEPAAFVSFEQFEGVVNSCGERFPLVAADFAGSSWVETWEEGEVTVVETINFINDGTASITETEDGEQVDAFVVNWEVINDYLVLSLPGVFQDVWAITPSGIKVYTEEATWSSLPDLSTLDDSREGEIWTANYINSENIAPVANPDLAMINEDTPVTTGNVLDNDTDLDSGPFGLSIAGFEAVSANGGTVSNNGDGTFDYVPAENFNGDDIFTYTVSDGEDTVDGIVTITVHSVNDLPVIQQDGPLVVEMDEDGSPMAFVAPLVTVVDPDAGGFVWSSSTASKGDADVGGTGSSPFIDYVPDPDANGGDSFIVTVYDGDGGFDSITVQVTIAPINDLPVIIGTPQIIATDGVPYRFTPLGIDPDPQQKTFSIVNKPDWADFDENTGKLSGTPALNDIGTHNGIVISLTTGLDTVSLPAFSISVSAGTGLGAVWGPHADEFKWDDGSLWQ